MKRLTEIAIFSFNRGGNLRVCVESIQRNAPGIKYTVYDDRSDDPATLEYLEKISDRVITAPLPKNERHGGLYANMNLALSQADHPFLMTLQDDMQLVRTFSQDDDEDIERIFNS